jgi:hypothetical protein
MVKSGVKDFSRGHALGQKRLDRLQEERGLADLPGSGQQQRPMRRRLGHPGQDFVECGPMPVRKISGAAAAPPRIVLPENRQQLRSWSYHGLESA